MSWDVAHKGFYDIKGSITLALQHARPLFVAGQRITTIQLDGVQYFVSRMNPYSPELNYFLAYQYCRWAQRLLFLLFSALMWFYDTLMGAMSQSCRSIKAYLLHTCTELLEYVKIGSGLPQIARGKKVEGTTWTNDLSEFAPMNSGQLLIWITTGQRRSNKSIRHHQ